LIRLSVDRSKAASKKVDDSLSWNRAQAKDCLELYWMRGVRILGAILLYEVFAALSGGRPVKNYYPNKKKRTNRNKGNEAGLFVHVKNERLNYPNKGKQLWVRCGSYCNGNEEFETITIIDRTAPVVV